MNRQDDLLHKIDKSNRILYRIEGEGSVDLYTLSPGIYLSFNEIHTSSWTTGDNSIFSLEMLILNFCLHGRCDVSLVKSQYAIVKEEQVCASTMLPTKDFYYPGRLYEGIQLYIDRQVLRTENAENFLVMMGIDIEQMINLFCSENRVYLHRMSSSMSSLVKQTWILRDEPELGQLRYMTVRLLHEWVQMPSESETALYFTKSQIAIVKDAESLVLSDLSRRFTAKELAGRFGISESSLKLYMRGVLGDSYLNYFRKKRMERAAELLESTNLKVIEIANAVGYENQGKFAKVFADCYGMPPLEFRRLSK